MAYLDADESHVLLLTKIIFRRQGIGFFVPPLILIMNPEETEHPLHPLVHTSRKDFVRNSLEEGSLLKNPFNQFKSWMLEAFKEEGELANAMVLGTAGKDGLPHTRVVLLRDISHGGFTFFTNYHSKKGQEIELNPLGSLLFFWKELERQIRIEGTLQKLPAAESDAYFASRPFESKVAAWASDQSEVVASREHLQRLFDEKLAEFKDKDIGRPEHWGGYVLIPTRFEFWQGRANRLHDRIQYTPRPHTSDWLIERLMP